MSSPKEPLSYQKAYHIEYYKKNKEKFREKSSERYKNLTPDEKKQNSILKKAWYQENKDAVKLKEYKRYWNKRRGF
jgi:parvulin-like peptidyl-prolyl isomerase